MKLRRLITLCCGVFVLGAHTVYGQGRPNIVIVLADDTGYSDFGCYGGEIETPNIDRLAENGIRWSQFHSENKCNPSRAALMTGQYYIRGYHSGTSVTIAEALSTAGYRNYISGKWDITADTPGGPLKRGFDHFFGNIRGCGSYFAPLGLVRDGKDAEHEWRDNRDFYYTHAITASAVDYIRQTPADCPLFLHVTYTAPHWPLHALPSDVGKYKSRYADGWDVLRQRRLKRMKKMGLVPANTPLPPRNKFAIAWEDAEHTAWEQRRMEVYAAMIDSMDQGIGKIVQTLEETGRFEDTLFIVLGDNGASSEEYSPNRVGRFLNTETRDGRPLRVGNLRTVMPGPEDTWQSYGPNWASLSATPFRLYKGYEHQGGIVQPFIVHWPQVIRQGGRISHAVGHIIDVLPTTLDAAGVDYPESFDGRRIAPADGKSLLPIFRNETRPGHDALYWGSIYGKAVRQGKWKLVRQHDQAWELYDMEADRTELNNLAPQYPEKVQAMEKLWQAWRDSANLPKKWREKSMWPEE